MMIFSTADPLLLVEESRMCHIDPQNPNALFSMWSVFSKAAGIIEQGQRLEHMSWRLWAHQSIRERSRRKQQQEEQQQQRPSSFTKTSSSSTASSLSHPSTCCPALDHPGQDALPALSRSVESVTSTCSQAPTMTATGFHVDEMPAVDLTHLVSSIKHTQSLDGPITTLGSPAISPANQQPMHSIPSRDQNATPTQAPSLPLPVPFNSSASTIASGTTDNSDISPGNCSETSAGSGGSEHSIVRGFKPGLGSTYKSQTQLAASPTPILKSSDKSSTPTKKKKTAQFQIGSGGSTSSPGSPCTLQRNMSTHPLKTTGHAKQAGGPTRKQASFKSEITEIPTKKGTFEIGSDDDEGAIEDDTEEEDVDDAEDDSSQEEEVSESAIEDDDDAWEDEGEVEDVAKELTFHRVDSRPELVSRRSAIWDQLHGHSAPVGPQRSMSHAQLLRRSPASNLGGSAMNTSAIDDDDEDDDEDDLSMELRTKQPMTGYSRQITSTLQPGMPAIQPRDTRQNIINKELGVELRKEILNERQTRHYFKSNPLPKRAHTSVDMRLLAAQAAANPPGRGGVNGRSSTNTSWNDIYDPGNADYHQTGW